MGSEKIKVIFMKDLKTLPVFVLLMLVLIYCLISNEISSIMKPYIIVTIIISFGIYLPLNFDELFGRK